MNTVLAIVGKTKLVPGRHAQLPGAVYRGLHQREYGAGRLDLAVSGAFAAQSQANTVLTDGR